MTEIEFTDRYQALGIPYPDPETVCTGQCEGTGVVPIHGADVGAIEAKEGHLACPRPGDDVELWRELWREAEKQSPTDDGYHFVKCPECGGSGKRP